MSVTGDGGRKTVINPFICIGTYTTFA